jgi:hypothetical protein
VRSKLSSGGEGEDGKHMMQARSFSKAIAIEGSLITNPDQAANYLLERWPVSGGEQYEFAKRVCLEAIEGKREPDDARAALVLAAREAGISATA